MRRRCSTISAPSPSRSTNGSTASPKGKVAVCEANRLKYKGNWKLAYDNSGDGYHVVFSHRSLLEMENRQADVANKGMSYYKGSPDTAPMYMAYMGNGHHFKDKRPNIEKRAGGLWAVEGPAPGTEHYQEELRRRFGARAEEILDLASSEPVNINVFPNFSLLGNHIQVFEPVSVDETNVTWYGTAVVDEDGVLGGAVDEINALRMRTQEQFPNFGEVDDLANFEEIQRGLACQEDEWVYMHRGLGIPGRVKTDADGIITAPATDEAFMREYIKEWKRLMKATPEPGRAARAVSTGMQLTPRSLGQLLLRQRRVLPRAGREFHRLAARRAGRRRSGRARSLPHAARARGAPARSAPLRRMARAVLRRNASTGCRARPRRGDPRREIAISFDDRRRMEDRIYRLRTGYAWSQAPKSRTVRMVSNVEVFATKQRTARMVRSNFLISEFRVDGTRYLSGWCGHRFVERDGRWEIQVRQVNLIDCDQNLRNPSIVL